MLEAILIARCGYVVPPSTPALDLRGVSTNLTSKATIRTACRLSSAPVTLVARAIGLWSPPGQHRPAGLQELRGEQVHEDPVVAAPHGHARATAAPHLAEADLGIDPDRPLVPRSDPEHDVVQAEDGEAPVERESGRLGPQPLTAPLAQ